MSGRMDWDGAKRRDRQRFAKLRASSTAAKTRQREKDTQRQIYLQAFAGKHELPCFACKKNTVGKWAKSGWNKRGPWIICVSCVARRHSQTGGSPAKSG